MGKVDDDKNGVGAPTKYKEEYVDKVDEYLSANVDEGIEIVKQANTEKGYEMYDHKLKVKLPTVGGFAIFLGVSERTLYNWGDDYPEFLQSLEKIVQEQKKRLINMGLSGDYNSTIAKLILSANHGMREGVDMNLGPNKDSGPLIIKIVHGDKGNGTIREDLPK